MSRDHPFKNKHYLIKNHAPHRAISYAILTILAISILLIFGIYNIGLSDFILESADNMIITLLFLLNFNIIVLIVLFLWFVTDIKDALYEEEGLLSKFLKKK